MASKKYIGKPCAYCVDAKSTTGDHVLARAFVSAKARANLPQVPACTKCNGDKAALEHYLTAVLPEAARHADAAAVKAEAARRLERNPRLKRKQEDGAGFIEMPNGERIDTKPLDPQRMATFNSYILKGLYHYVYEHALPKQNLFLVGYFVPEISELIDKAMAGATALPREEAVGNGALKFKVVELDGMEGLQLWTFSIYDLQMSGGKMPVTNAYGLTASPNNPHAVILSHSLGLPVPGDVVNWAQARIVEMQAARDAR